MSDATTAAPAASPAPDATGAPAPAPAPTAAPAAAPAATPAPAPTAAPAPTPAPTAAPAAAPKADDKPAGAPEAYTDFTLPEGVQTDAAAMDAFKATAKELGLTQEDAQKLVTMQAQQVATQVTGWQEATKADKEIGGDKLPENLATAKRALEAFGSPELTAMLDRTGLGYHPEVIRAFYRVGQAISQDGFVPGRRGSGTPTPQSMYSASNMNP